MPILQRAAALLSTSIFAGRITPPGIAVDATLVDQIRESLGGNLVPPPVTKLEWFLEEVDQASQIADMGDLAPAAKLTRAARRDPIISGLLATKSGGITRLPKVWYGDETVVEDLTTKAHGIPRFDLLCPPAEVKTLADDADFFKIAFFELIPVVGRPYPVLRRIDPERFVYLWQFDSWFLRSSAGIIPWTPGNGRCGIHYAGPQMSPWQFGNWHSVGRSWVRKDTNQHLKQNWAFHLANAARVAVSPRAATKTDRAQWLSQVAAWGINSVFNTPEGWDVKLLESNGRGWEGFDTSIKEANEDFMIALAGQLVSVTGGTGFSSEDLYASIRYDLIQETATPLAHTISTQVLPEYTRLVHPEVFDSGDIPGFTYDVRRPDDLSKEASIYTALGAGIESLQEAAATAGLEIDVRSLFQKYGIPTRALSEETKRAMADKLVAQAASNDGAAKKAVAQFYTLTRALQGGPK